MRIKKTLSITLLLFIVVLCNAQVRDFYPFAGVWVTDPDEDSLQVKLTLSFSTEGYPMASTELLGKTNSTKDIAVADGTLYIRFFLRTDTLDYSEIIKNYRLCIGELKNGRLSLRCKDIGEKYDLNLEDERVLPFSDTILVFSRKQRVEFPQIQANETFDSFDDTIGDAFSLFISGYYYMQNPDSIWLAELYFDKAIEYVRNAKPDEISYNDKRIIEGYSNFFLMNIYKDLYCFKEYGYPEFINEYARSAFLNLPAKERAGRMDALLNMSQSLSDMFDCFQVYCEYINELRGSDSIVDRYHLKVLLIYRSEFFQKYMDDTERSIADLERAASIDLKEVPVLDSICNVFLSIKYANMGLASDKEPDEPPRGNAKVYYQKSLDCFDAAKVESFSDEESVGLIGVIYSYQRLNDDKPLPKILKDASDSIVDYYYSNPDVLSHQTEYIITMVMERLSERNSYDSLLVFYDSIKNNLRFNPIVNMDYLLGLVNSGYAASDVAKLLPRLSAVGTKGKAMGGYVKIYLGDLDGAFEDLFGNENFFNGKSFVFSFIVSMLGDKLDYEDALEVCSGYLQSISGIDSSIVLCYRGIYFLCAAEENPPKAVEYRERAKEDLREVIDYEKRHGEFANMPYAYFWLGLRDSTLIAVEKMLVEKDSLDSWLIAADIYCRIGDMNRAKLFVEKVLQSKNSPFIRALLKTDFNLLPIQNFVDKICKKYEEKEAKTARHLHFQMKTTMVPCTFSENGSVYVSCNIGGFNEDKVLVDVGANYVHITKKRAILLSYGGDLNILDDDPSKMADGRISKEKYVVLPYLTIGDITLKNVVAAISNDPSADTLLGQNVLGNFNIEIDHDNAQIKLTQIEVIRDK